MEDWASDSFFEDYEVGLEATQSDERLLEPLLVEPLAFSKPVGDK